MEKVTNMIDELVDAVSKEYLIFYGDEVKKDTKTVIANCHKIDIYRHLINFFTDNPEAYLEKQEIECLLKKKGEILKDLYLFITDSLDAPPYGSYEQCSEIVSGYVEIGF